MFFIKSLLWSLNFVFSNFFLKFLRIYSFLQNLNHDLAGRFQVGLLLSKKVGFVCFSEISLKMVNNVFYFIFLFLRFLFWFLGHEGKRLHKKVKVNFKTHNLRSSHLEVFCKKGALKNFARFAGKHLCRVSF